MIKDHKCLGVLTGIVLMGMLMWGCSANPAPSDGQTAAAKEQTMRHDSAAVQLPSAVPFIDTQIPAQFDTATFGLG
jgi:PBP1b-binding outer membrane lipoprotein LpoB